MPLSPLEPRLACRSKAGGVPTHHPRLH